MERFDAFDEKGNPLGFDLIRGESFPQGAYNKVVQIYTFDQNHHLLITLRHPTKVFGNYWEVTAGAVLKGEHERQGALRELEEETGLQVNPSSLVLFDHHLERHSLWYSYVVVLNEVQPSIRYQANETVDHRWIKLDQFESELQQDLFPNVMVDRFKNHKNTLLESLSRLGVMV